MADGHEGKVGTWCKKYDAMCSSYFNVKSHTSYETDGIYEDASRYILSKNRLRDVILRLVIWRVSKTD